MSARKPPPAVGLSMLDLVSNALAAVIILFFILAATKYPTLPPLRTCGTVVVEFTSEILRDTTDKSHLYVSYNYHQQTGQDIGIEIDGKKIKKNDYFFGSNMIKLSEGIRRCPKNSSNCGYDSTLNPTLFPPLNCFQSFDERITRHTIIMRDPPEGIWNLGLLYTDHLRILNDSFPDRIHISVHYYKETTDYSGDTIFPIKAPTSSVSVLLTFPFIKQDGSIEKIEFINDTINH